VITASAGRNNPGAGFPAMSAIRLTDLIGRAPGRRKLVAVVYADMVGYSRLIGRDDLGTFERLRTLRRTLINPAIDEHGGKLVQTGGDSLLIAFDSIDGAVGCAIKMQQQMPVYDGNQPPDQAIRFRVGINIGDVIADGTNLHGDGVNVAARLQGECPPGGICVSRAVRDHVHGRLNLVFDELGARSLKNIIHPVEAFVLRPAAETAASSLTSLAPLACPNVRQPKLPRRSAMMAPLRNLDVPEEHERLLEGVIEDICGHMARWGISMIGPAEAPVRIGDSLGPRTIARELGVSYLIQPSARRARNQIEVNLQLIEAEIGIHVWSEWFRIDLGDTTETCHLMARTVFKKLSLEVNSRLNALPSHEWAPSDFILRGHTLLFRPTSTETYYSYCVSFCLTH
jgi:adenylate cyclase